MQGKDFIYRTPFSQGGSHEIKVFLNRVNETNSGVKRKPTEWERISVSYSFDRRLII